MNKQIILVRTRPGETRIARIDEKFRLIDFSVYRKDGAGEGQSVGEIFLGRVRRVVPAMEAAFVDIGQEKDAFLGLGDARLQIHYGPEEPTDKISDHVHEGEAIMVQVLADAREAKGAKITKRINITGDMMVFSPVGEKTARVSSRINNKPERARLLEIAQGLLGETAYTIIVRSAAEGASTEDLLAELEKLKNKWAKLSQMAKNAKAPSHLGIDESALGKYLKDSGLKFVEKIITDDPSQCAASVKCEMFAPEKTNSKGGGSDIFKAFNISDQIDGILDPVVELPSGGSLIIEETSALTAIDVNSASAAKPSGKGARASDIALETNIEAVVEAARQIRIRNLAGIIVIDLMAMRGGTGDKKILDHARAAMADDPARPRIYGITKTGLLEITRPRRRPPLSHILSAPCSQCPSGRAISPLSSGLMALEAVLIEVSANPGLMPTLAAHSDIILALENEASGALAEMETKIGQPLELLIDNGLKKGQFRIDRSQQ
ncbi:MAG: ribonuclease E/G [Rhodospirillaceae bacterium]|nr:ribonuclease E/G [Rhodospirillaceae bacterium]